jgi:hypothetical protein
MLDRAAFLVAAPSSVALIASLCVVKHDRFLKLTSP